MKVKIAGLNPVVVNLNPGVYWWCACGEVLTQPFCDGTHAGTEFSPERFEVVKESRWVLCTCKRSKDAPICDGSHRKLEGTPGPSSTLGEVC